MSDDDLIYTVNGDLMRSHSLDNFDNDINTDDYLDSPINDQFVLEFRAMSKKTIDLQREVKELENKNEDLNSRLEIAHRKIESLTSTSETEIKNALQAYKMEKGQLQQSLQREIQDKEHMKREFENQINSLKRKLEEEKKAKNQYMTDIDHFLRFAEFHYNTAFTCLSDVQNSILRLHSPVTHTEAYRNDTLVGTPVGNAKCVGESDLHDKIKKLKKKNQKLKALNEELTENLEVAKEQSAQFTYDLESQLEITRKKCVTLEEEAVFNEQKNQSVINNLQSQIESLNQKLRQTEQKLSESVNKQHETAEGMTNLRSEYLASENNVKKLVKKNSKYKTQILQLQKDLKKFTEDLSHKDNQITEYGEISNNLERENCNLNELLNSTSNQNVLLQRKLASMEGDLRNYDLKITEQKERIEGLQLEIRRRNDTISQLELTGKKAEREINRLNTEKIKTESNNNMLKSSMVAAERQKQSEIDILNRTIEQQRLENDKLRNENTKATFEKIPLSTWRCDSFRENLNDILSKIGSNEAMPLATRVSCCFDAISSYFNVQKNQLEEDPVIRAKLDFLEELIPSVSAIIASDKSSVDEIVTHNMTIKEYLDKAVLCRDVVNRLKSKNHVNEEIIEKVLRLIQAGSPQDIHSKLSELLKENEELREKSSILQSENKKRTKLEDRLRNELESCENEIDNLKMKLERETNTSRQAQKNYEHQLQQVYDEVRRSSTSPIETTPKRADPVSFVDADRVKDELYERINELNAKNDRLLAERDALAAELADKSKHLDQKSSQFNKIKQKNKRMKSQLDELEEQCHKQIDQIKQQYMKESKRNQDEIRNEIDQLKQRYVGVNVSLKARKDELESEVVAARDHAKKCDNTIKSMQKKLASLEEERTKAHTELLAYREKLDKERKIHMMRSKTEAIANEHKHITEMEDLKAQYEAEKRKLYGFVASQFMFFFDARVQLQDESFKQVLHKAKSELDRLTKFESSVCSLLSISKDESAESAIINLLNRKNANI